METLKEQIERHGELQLELLRQRRAMQETEASFRQARFALREARQAEVDYESSLRFVLDRVTGKAEAKQAELTRKIHHAQGMVHNGEIGLEKLRTLCRELEQELDSLPDWETLGTWAQGNNRALWLEQEVRLCVRQLLPVLEAVDEALEAYRALLRGERMGQMVSPGEQHQDAAAHIPLAESCAPMLLRLKNALAQQGKPLEVGGYFDHPAGFIDAAVARHNRINRVSIALKQVAELKKELRNL